jgi:hypothetical protein
VKALVQEFGLGNVFNINNNYINITNYSSQSSDSEGTLIYKRMRRDLDYEKKVEVVKRRDAERKLRACESEIFQLDKHIAALESKQLIVSSSIVINK